MTGILENVKNRAIETGDEGKFGLIISCDSPFLNQFFITSIEDLVVAARNDIRKLKIVVEVKRRQVDETVREIVKGLL